MYADWTDRIAAGELPAAAPPRPQGKERNVVVTMWDWADPKAYLHDEIASDKRNPTVNANGPIYGALEASADYMPVVDPMRNAARQVKLPVRDPKTPSEAQTPPAAPSPYWGDEAIWTSQTSAHSFAMDKQSRVWIAARIRPNQTADFCQQGSTHPSAKAFPINQSGRQMQMYDPKTKQVTTIDTCFGTHHLNFDNNDILWFTGGGPVEGWFDTKVYDETKDEQKAQGWTVFVLDTNGNGKRDAYVEPDQPVDPTKDKRINAPFYGVAPSPVDDSIWGSVAGHARDRSSGWCPDPNPPATALSEIYEVPWNNPKAPGSRVCSARHGRRQQRRRVDGAVERAPRQLRSAQVQGPAQRTDRDRAALPGRLGAVSVARGPTTKAPWIRPAPTRPTMTSSIASTCSAWARDIPLATGNESEALLALVDGKFLTFRVPYPMGFYAKGMDGRIDDPNAGWKGKGIWTTFATRAPFHVEGGKGTTSKLVKFQVRPEPLAK